MRFQVISIRELSGSQESVWPLAWYWTQFVGSIGQNIFIILSFLWKSFGNGFLYVNGGFRNSHLYVLFNFFFSLPFSKPLYRILSHKVLLSSFILVYQTEPFHIFSSLVWWWWLCQAAWSESVCCGGSTSIGCIGSCVRSYTLLLCYLLENSF